MIPVAVKAIQEQQEQIKSLQEENATLKNALNKLFARVEALEQH